MLIRKDRCPTMSTKEIKETISYHWQDVVKMQPGSAQDKVFALIDEYNEILEERESKKC